MSCYMSISVPHLPQISCENCGRVNATIGGVLAVMITSNTKDNAWPSIDSTNCLRMIIVTYLLIIHQILNTTGHPPEPLLNILLNVEVPQLSSLTLEYKSVSELATYF